MALLRLVLVVVPLHRLKRAAAHTHAEVTVRELSPLQLAFLVGGPKRALLTAFAAFAEGSPPRLAREPLPRRLHALGVHDSALSQHDVVVRAQPEIDALGASLAARGLLLDPRQTGPLRRVDAWLSGIGVAIAIVVFLGALYLLHGFFVSVGAALLAMVPQALCGVLLGPKSFVLPAATRLVDSAKSEFSYLDPKLGPQYRAYGDWALSLGTALFGGAALAGMPEIATLPLFQTLLTAQPSSFGGSGACATSGYDCGTDSANGCGGSCSGGDSSCGGSGCSGCGGCGGD